MRRQRGFSFIELLMVTAVIGILAGLAVPFLHRARMTTNEKTSMASLRTVFAAQSMHHSRHQTFGSIDDLVDNELLDNSMNTGEKNGYTFLVTSFDTESFSAVAVPVSGGVTGDKGFYIDETGVLRFTEDGSIPTASSPAWQ